MTGKKDEDPAVVQAANVNVAGLLLTIAGDWLTQATCVFSSSVWIMTRGVDAAASLVRRQQLGAGRFHRRPL